MNPTRDVETWNAALDAAEKELVGKIINHYVYEQLPLGIKMVGYRVLEEVKPVK